MAATTGPVVDSRFCAPHATAFTVSKKVRWPDRNMTIRDAGGARVMRVEGELWCWPRSSHLLDAASCHTVVTVRRCPSMRTAVTPRWEAFRGGSTRPEDLLFATVSQSLVFGRGVVHVHLASGNPRYGERRVDYVVVCGGQDGRECTVSRGRSDGHAVATINRTTEPSDLPEYSVTVNPGVDRAFILALTVILEEIRVDEVWRRKN